MATMVWPGEAEVKVDFLPKSISWAYGLPITQAMWDTTAWWFWLGVALAPLAVVGVAFAFLRRRVARGAHGALTTPPSVLRLVPLMVVSVLRATLAWTILAEAVLLIAGRFDVLIGVYLVVLIALFRPLGRLQRELTVAWVNRRP